VTDVFDHEKRSEIMSRVRSKDTKPELLVRRTLHRMGYRYRLHARELPGTPDVVLPRHRKAVQVNSCFFHGHDCPRGKRPQTNAEWWAVKIDRNMARDAETTQALRCAGWDVLVVWQCQTTKPGDLEQLLRDFMTAPPGETVGGANVEGSQGEGA
jgi:DNA mismatch endonuclease (patch repair protein)